MFSYNKINTSYNKMQHFTTSVFTTSVFTTSVFTNSVFTTSVELQQDATHI
jgi:hypothetical protein